MFNINYFEAFALSNSLPIGPALSMPNLGAGDTPASCTPPRDRIPYEDCSLPERGEFPLDAIPIVLSDYARQLADAYQIPVELPSMCMISAISGALGKQWEAVNAASDRKTRGNLLVILSLPSGSGKSVSSRIARPIQSFEDCRTENWLGIERPRISSEIQALESEIHVIKRPKGKETLNRTELTSKITRLEEYKRQLAYSPALITGNATTSGFAAELSRVDKETLWVFSAEAGEVVRVMLGVYRKEGTDMDLWLSGYSGESYKQVRAGTEANSIQLKDPCLSALLMVQPCVLNELLNNSSARERGLLTRIFAVSIEADLPYDDGTLRRVCTNIERRWERLIEEVLQIRFNLPSPRELSCPEETVRIFRDFYNDTTHRWANGKYADHRNQLARWRENAIRLAVVLQVASNPHSQVLEPETARAAVRLFKWIGLGGLEVASNDREEKLRGKVSDLEKILRASGGSRLASDLLKRNGFKMAELRQLADVFPARIKIEETAASPTGGRPGNWVSLLSTTHSAPEHNSTGEK